MNVRVRFAPSPTGPLHIGGVRTALYNYLFARKHNGAFILRMEDTDQTRYVPGAEEYIIEALKWTGMVPDEGPTFGGDYGPYRQSERREIYQKHIKVLLENGTAYYAFDTPEELDEMRTQMQNEGVHTPKYDHVMRQRMRNSLTLSAQEVEALLASGAKYTVRLKIDPGSEVTFEDRVRGAITFSTSELDDKVLMKTDGLPTYHFANVVDDHSMLISHVIRGEEWLSSTPHHVLMYRAFGWQEEMPEFSHLPLILKPSGKGKLSKRDGAKFGFPVFPLNWDDGEELAVGFREAGFTPAGLLNFLAFLGWNPGTEQEIFDTDGLVDAFDLDRVTKSGARFDYDKARWFNGQHIHKMETGSIAERLGLTMDGHTVGILELYKDRVDTLEGFADAIRIYKEGFNPEVTSEGLVRKKWSREFSDHFAALADVLADTDWDEEALGNAMRNYIKENGLKFGDAFKLLRVSLSGTEQGPDIAGMFKVLGQEEALRRLRGSLAVFNELSGNE